jgi:hypothetical protein
VLVCAHVPPSNSRYSRCGTSCRSWRARALDGCACRVLTASSGCGSRVSGPTGDRPLSSLNLRPSSAGIVGDSGSLGREESSPWATDGPARRPTADSHDVGSKPLVGCTADPWRTAETRTGSLPSHRREVDDPPPATSSQTWRAFLENHLKELVSADFFTVPTLRFQVLYVFLIMAHDRRPHRPFQCHRASDG